MTHYASSNEDRRIQRTRKLIQTALIELTIQKGFAAVTVSDITEYAGVNRATFYRHYQDKFDLLDQYAREVYQLLDEAAETVDQENSTSGLANMFDHVRAHTKFYRVMLSKDGDPAFAEKIRHYVRKRIQPALPDEFRAKPLADLYLSYVSSAAVGVVLWWLENNLPYSSTEMAAICFRLAGADMSAMLEHVNLSRAKR